MGKIGNGEAERTIVVMETCVKTSDAFFLVVVFFFRF